MAFEIGTKVHVTVNARVTGQYTTGLDSTRTVTENEGPGQWTHLLFLSSPSITGITGSKDQVGDVIRAEFDAEVTGGFKQAERVTTRVRELSGSGSGFTHYLYLNSPAVTVLPEREAPGQAKPVGGTRITPADTVFESAEVLNRIAELEDGAAVVRYRVTQKRNGQALNPADRTLRTYAEAVDFLDERDYNQARFTIEPVKGPLSDEDQEELTLLKKLNEDGRDRFGSPQWITAGVRMYNDEYFTEDWARNRTVAKLNVAPYRLDEWPLNLIAWDHATQAVLDDKYTSVDFGNEVFWGSDTDTA